MSDETVHKTFFQYGNLMKLRFFLFFMAGFILAGGTAYPKERTISLKECVAIALENHPDIMASRQDRNKAQANYNLSLAPSRIIINGELRTVEYLKENTSAAKFSLPGKDTTFGIFAGATANYIVYDANRTRNQEAAKLNIGLAKMNEQKVESGIILNVKSTYYAYAFARDHTVLKQELKRRFGIKLEKTRLLFKNGQRPVQDVTKAEVDLASAALEYERAVNQENLAKIQLLAALGIDDKGIDVQPLGIDTMPVLRFNLKELYALAENNYPELRISRMNKEVQKINIAVQKSNRSPSLSVFGSLGFENKDLAGTDNITDNFKPDRWDPTFHAGLQARVPIYSGGGIPARVDAAVAEYNKAVYSEKKLLLSMKSMIRNYHQEMGELKKQIDLSGLMKENAKKHLDFARRSYENGIGSQLELQDAESAVINAEIFYIKAKYDYLSALAKLSNTVGVEEDFLCGK